MVDRGIAALAVESSALLPPHPAAPPLIQSHYPRPPTAQWRTESDVWDMLPAANNSILLVHGKLDPLIPVQVRRAYSMFLLVLFGLYDVRPGRALHACAAWRGGCAYRPAGGLHDVPLQVQLSMPPCTIPPSLQLAFTPGASPRHPPYHQMPTGPLRPASLCRTPWPWRPACKTRGWQCSPGPATWWRCRTAPPSCLCCRPSSPASCIELASHGVQGRAG